MAAYHYINQKGTEYYLHGAMVTLKGGRQQQIYYFAKKVNPKSSLDFLPQGYEIVENERTGLPVLKKTISS